MWPPKRPLSSAGRVAAQKIREAQSRAIWADPGRPAAGGGSLPMIAVRYRGLAANLSIIALPAESWCIMPSLCGQTSENCQVCMHAVVAARACAHTAESYSDSGSAKKELGMVRAGVRVPCGGGAGAGPGRFLKC